jgi:hypothetical protein
MWFDIRCAPGQQQPIAGIQERRQVDPGPERGYQHRNRVGARGDGLDVLLAGHVEVMLPTQPAVGWNSDERQASHV